MALAKYTTGTTENPVEWVPRSDYDKRLETNDEVLARYTARAEALTKERDAYILKQQTWEAANEELRTAHIVMLAALRAARTVLHSLHYATTGDSETVPIELSDDMANAQVLDQIEAAIALCSPASGEGK